MATMNQTIHPDQTVGTRQGKPVKTFAPTVQSADWGDHVRTYHGFIHLVKWFCIHTLIVMVALYFFVIGDNAAAGMAFLVLALGLFIFGTLCVPQIAEDAQSVIASATHHRNA